MVWPPACIRGPACIRITATYRQHLTAVACISTIRSDLRPVFDFDVVLFEMVTIISAGCTDENSITSARRSDTVQILLSVHPHHWPPANEKVSNSPSADLFFELKMHQNPFSAGAVPWTPLGELMMLPQVTSRLGRGLRSEFETSRGKGRAIPPPHPLPPFPYATLLFRPLDTNYWLCQGPTLNKILTLTLALTLYKNT